MTSMIYSATIQWKDSKEIAEVLITTYSVEDCTEEEDENIFFYFDTEEEIKDYMTKDNREFRVLDYTSYDMCKKCNTPWDEHEHPCTVYMTQNYNEQTLLQMEQYLEEQIGYYDRLSETRNGFELACKGGREALKKALEYFIKIKNR